MTTGTGESGAYDFARDWQAVRGDADIQFAPIEPPEPADPPQWWLDVIDFFDRLMSPVVDAFAAVGRAIGVSGEVLMWVTLGVAVLAVGAIIVRRVMLLAKAGGKEVEIAPEWTPDADEALALLDDADRLADEGRYDEATHLLLKRSVGQIAAARPGLLEPSSTAREIAALPALPDAARGAFGTIAERVERSLFALRSLDVDDWRAARSAYAEFALATPVPA